MVTCEIVKVIMEDEAGNMVNAFWVPAYTRSPGELRAILYALISEYMDKSHKTGDSVSLGDFALYAISKAAYEPRVIE